MTAADLLLGAAKSALLLLALWPWVPGATPAVAAQSPQLSASSAAGHAHTEAGQARSWMLTEADLRALLPAPAAVAEPDHAGHRPDKTSAKAVPLPAPGQAQALLLPLKDLEFPTRELFVRALRNSACDYFKEHVRQVLKALDEQAESKQDVQCPEPMATRSAAATGLLARPLSGRLHHAAEWNALQVLKERRTPAARPAPQANPASGELTLLQFYDLLLTDQRVQAVVEQAQKLHPMSQLQPMLMEPSAPCACNPATPTDQAYGLLAYWHAQEKPLVVDYSRFTRIGFLGAVLQNDGTYQNSFLSLPKGLDFVRQARQHATAVDLVIYARDWSFLRQHQDKSDRQRFIAEAVSGAMALADTPLHDATRVMHRLLIPPWRASDHAFDGITLFLDESDPQDGPRFEPFLHEFVAALQAQMKQRKRGLQLNVVVPAERVLETGAYNIGWLWDNWLAHEDGLSPKAKEDRRQAAGVGKAKRKEQRTDVTVNYLVLLAEPTSDTKKQLRSQLDASRTVTGEQRVRLLQSLVPMLVQQHLGPVATLPATQQKQLEDDLAYMRWNYGGAGVWPLPALNSGHGASVRALLAATFGPRAEGKADTPSLAEQACAFICPIRVPLRLLFQMMLVVGIMSIGLYGWNRHLKKVGGRLERGLMIGGAATAVVALALLFCDPDLSSLREGQVVLIVPLGLALAWVLYRRRKAKRKAT